MTSPIVKFLRKVFGVKERVNIHLDPESVRVHNQVRALSNENAELKGWKARKLAEEGKQREREQDKNEDESVRWKLDKQTKELQKKVYPKYFSLKSFYSKLIRDKNFRNKIGFYDFKRSTKMSKFGDIGFSSDGKIILLDDNGIILMAGNNLKQIFQSVAGLSNDISTFKIPLNVNEEGEYIENLMEYDMPTIYQTPEGKFQVTTAKKRPLYEYVRELQNEISEKDHQIEELENTITNFSKKISEYEVSRRVAIDQSETDRANLSEVTKGTSEIGKQFRQLGKELALSRDSNTLLEDNVDKLVRQLEKMRNEAENEGTKKQFDRVLETFQNVRSTIVRDEPEQVIKIVEKSQNSPQNTIK